jgi:polar amino acid transport system ATP-binding protein
MDLITGLRAEGRNLILVTHQMGFARQASDYALFLAEGRIVEHGPSSALFESPQTEQCRRFLTTVMKY